MFHSNRRRGWSRTGEKPVRALPILTGFRALTFHTLLSFQGASSDRSSRLPWWFPFRSRRRSGGHPTRAFQGASTEQPIAPGVPGAPTVLARGQEAAGDPTVGRPRVFPGSRHPPYLLPASSRHMAARLRGDTRCGQWAVPQSHYLGPLAPPRHQHFIQKSRPAPCSSWASGRPPPAVGSAILLALGDLLSVRADAELTPPERSRSSKNVPYLVRGEGSTAIDTVSTSYPSSGNGLKPV
jgi:hypothetical protein